VGEHDEKAKFERYSKVLENAWSCANKIRVVYDDGRASTSVCPCRVLFTRDGIRIQGDKQAIEIPFEEIDEFELVKPDRKGGMEPDAQH